jgi:uncharacterized membrane protein YraQ (UPF0718 family)
MTNKGVVFLFIVIFLYILTLLIKSEIALNALAFSTKLFSQILPVLLLIFVLIFVSNFLVKPDWVRLNVGKGSGLRGWLVALVGGILSVGPIYAWYALLRDLQAKGMRTALIAVFLYNRGIKLPLLPLMIHYFGGVYTLILAVYMTLFSLVGGLILEKVLERKGSP